MDYFSIQKTVLKKLERENLLLESDRIKNIQSIFKRHMVIKDHIDIHIHDICDLDKNFQKKTIDKMVGRIGRPINDYNRSEG